MEKDLKKNSSLSSEESYTFDPIKDIAPVDQVGFVDLRDAFVNHSIPGDLTVKSEDYNGVDDPSSLLGRPSDVFDAYRKAQYVKSAESKAAERLQPALPPSE